MNKSLARVITEKNGIPYTVKTRHQGLLPVSDVSSNLPFLQQGDQVLVLFSDSSLMVLERIEPLSLHQAKCLMHQKHKQSLNLNDALMFSEEKGLSINSHIEINPQGRLQLNGEKIYISSEKDHFKLKARSLNIQTHQGIESC